MYIYIYKYTHTNHCLCVGDIAFNPKMAEMRSVQDEKRGKEKNIKLSIINASSHKLFKKGGVTINRRELIMIFIYINL